MRARRRLLLLLAVLLVYLVSVSLLYRAGMGRLEAKPRTFLESLQWAADTFSTTGYGRDTSWSHPLMIALVMAVQFSGMLVVPLLIGLFVLPYLSELFEQRLPREAPATLRGHVIVYRYGPAIETLLKNLGSREISVLVAETDEVTARVARERGQVVVFRRSDDEILDACRLGSARALVANGRDEENAGVILRARQMGFAADIYAFVDKPAHRKPIELAGATAAFTPRHIIAAALAAHASDRLSPRLPGLEEVPGVVRREIRVSPTSSIAGMTIGDSALGARTGAVIVGRRIGSSLDPVCTANVRIEPNSVLELIGDRDSMDRAAAIVGGPLLRNEGRFLIAGFGEVGRKVRELLSDAGEEVRVVERERAEDVDVAGDVLDPSVLERAGVRQCRAVVLALDSDDATLFATVILRDVAPDVAIVARVNHSANLANIHRAGADFALSIADISGEMLTSRLLGRGARVRDERRRITKIEASRWVGQTLRDLPLRDHGCSAFAVERDGSVQLRLDPAMSIDHGDFLWICGTAEAVDRVR